jgi:hypothetical protein
VEGLAQEEMKFSPHPIQPLVKDEHGVLRFKENKIVSHILDWCASKNGHVGYNMNTSGPAPDLNTLAAMNFSTEDWQQLAQITGYSLSGYGSLGYVDDEAYCAAEKMSMGKDERDARIMHLRAELDALKKSLRAPMSRLFSVHIDDLK